MDLSKWRQSDAFLCLFCQSQEVLNFDLWIGCKQDDYWKITSHSITNWLMLPVEILRTVLTK